MYLQAWGEKKLFFSLFKIKIHIELWKYRFTISTTRKSMLLSERLARLFQVFKVHLFPSIRCTYVHWVPASGMSSLVGCLLNPEWAEKTEQTVKLLVRLISIIIFAKWTSSINYGNYGGAQTFSILMNWGVFVCVCVLSFFRFCCCFVFLFWKAHFKSQAGGIHTHTYLNSSSTIR